MRTFFLLVFASLIGLAVALGAIYYGDMQKSGDNIPLPSFTLPYKSFIAGTGIVEAGSKNIVIGSQVPGIIKDVFVQSGDKVYKGELLFRIDDTKERTILPVAEAKVQRALAKVASAKHQLEIIKKMKKVSANMVTKEKYTQLQDAYIKAQKELELARQEQTVLQKKLELYEVHSPIDGIVLRSNLTPGSYFDAASQVLVLGSSSYNVRVNINEFESWKFQKGAEATAFIRGNPKQEVHLEYLYTIPMVIPKTNLTGGPTEQTDTRVLQVMYKVKNDPDFPLYVGEMLDVFIQRTKGE